MLVLTVGNGVVGFTLDREMGSWVLTDEDIRIPEQTAEFAINMSNMRHWEAPVKRYIDDCLAGKRSEEHTSELQSLMRISYAVFCLKKKTEMNNTHNLIVCNEY